jgi:hypothetical protein
MVGILVEMYHYIGTYGWERSKGILDGIIARIHRWTVFHQDIDEAIRKQFKMHKIDLHHFIERKDRTVS